MNTGLVPKQIKNIHVVHDLLVDGNTKKYMLDLPFKPDIIKVNTISTECINLPSTELVKIVSNISNETTVIGNAVYSNSLRIEQHKTIFTSTHVPNLLEFTVLNNKNNTVDITGAAKVLFVYDISFIKY